MNKLVFQFLFCAFLLAFSVSSFAQVTIGSAKKPIDGSLLMLDDGTAGANGENSKKGLILPRVELTDVNNLFPMFVDDGSGGYKIGSTNYTKGTEDAAHIGLIVYNVEQVIRGSAACPTLLIDKGLHVWDGTQWQSLNSSRILPDTPVSNQTGWVGNTATGIGTLTDYEGNTYPTKRFNMNGTDAGIWTTVNSYSTRDRDGKLLDDGARLNPAYFSNATGAIPICSASDLGDDKSQVSYGEAAIVNPPLTSVSRMDFVKEFGLIYTHDQATTICPTGWHLPTNADWDNLALAHGGTSTAGSAMRKNRDYHLSADGVKYKWGPATETATLSGFDAIPSGYVYTGGAYARNFSYRAYWWSATTSGSYRYLDFYGSDLYSNTDGTGYYFPVRCVQD